MVPPVENKEKFLKLLSQFFAFSIPKTTTAKQLAIELAKRTRFLRDNVIEEELREEKIKGTQTLEGFYKAFKDHLISSLTLKDFSNLFAQTITYGLFAARSRAEDGFNRKLAYEHIPHTIGILRDVFRFISSTDLPKSMEWIVDDIAEVLDATDVKKIIGSFYKEGKGKDPIIHFYETFLAEYDPKEREKRGVYYTPEPVVSYIVRSVHKLLKEKFDKEDGFATNSVTVLDPASGTLTFPAFAIHEAVEEYKIKYGGGGVHNLIKDHILKNFYAFELMMAPYAVGHLKMGFVLDEFGYKLSEDERFKLYLTNTLESKDLAQSEIPGLISLSEESKLAGKVKREIPILVIVGNPPYSVSSDNKSQFIEKIMDLYKEDVRDERNIQPLSDDYIKFIRFAHWKIEQAGKGIIGMITNNSYLSGLIHRGMRKKLAECFDEIYILNLHGNSLIGETAPDGSKDENVFDIRQGVVIALFVKTGEKKKGLAKVYYQDLYGLRGDIDKKGTKYHYLWKNDYRSTKWRKISLEDPHNFFVYKDFQSKKEYSSYISLEEIFNKSKSGIASGKDDVLTDYDKNALGEERKRKRSFERTISERREGLARLQVEESEYLTEEPSTSFNTASYKNLEAELEEVTKQIQVKESELQKLKQSICERTDKDFSIAWVGLIDALARKRGTVESDYERLTAEIIAEKTVMDVIGDLRAEEDEKIEEVLDSDIIKDILPKITTHHKDIYLRNNALMVSDPPDDFPVSTISDGAKEQVFLALRITLALQWFKKEGLFLILDDAFIHSDNTRKPELEKRVVELGESGWQIICLTFDNRVKDLFEKNCENYNLLNLNEL